MLGKISKLKLLLRFTDLKQSECKYTLALSCVFEVALMIISFYENFITIENDIINILFYIISGLISLLGIAIAGVAIVISLFTPKQIEMLNKLKEGSFEILLFDFKWFGLVLTFEVAIFLLMILIIRTPAQLVSKGCFYVITFISIYLVFYVLFYACSLIGNCIALSKLKNSLEYIPLNQNNIIATINELKLDFLISKILNKKQSTALKFYKELIDMVKDSSISNKEEILCYLNERYTNNFKTRE